MGIINMGIASLLLLNLCFFFLTLSEARQGKRLPPALVVGTVQCDTCSQQVIPKSSHFISGASVAVKCGDETLKSSFYKEAKTDEHGEFQVYLPTHVSKHLESIKGCSVELVHSSESSCSVALSATSSSLSLKTIKEGTHIFSAGVFTFKPEFCDQKLTLPMFPENTELVKKTSLSTLHTVQKTATPDETLPTMPPVPTLPTTPAVPGVPAIPAVPGVPSGIPPVPGVPSTPPVPGVPATPTIPGVPGGSPTAPGVPSLPPPGGIPAVPGVPNPPVPGVPTVPTVPGVPGSTPKVPEVPSVPPVPGVPGIPKVPEVPSNPPVPGVPGIPPAFSAKKTPPP